MRRKWTVVCLSILSVVAVGKLGLVVDLQSLQHERVGQAFLNSNNKVLAVEQKQGLLQGGEWLFQELIPSAQAAKTITLPEEKMGDIQGAQVAILRQREAELEAKSQSLDERESMVVDAEKRASEKIAALQALQTRIEALLQQEESIKSKKIKRLTSVYEGMKAERAAPVIAQMDLNIVVKMFLRMNEKQVGKILSFLPPQKAVVISQALTQRVASLD